MFFVYFNKDTTKNFINKVFQTFFQTFFHFIVKFEMDILYIKSLIQVILNKTFADPARRIINDFDNRINFCCPVCLDSTKTAHKKRGNIFFDRLLFICFRCGQKCSLNTLCKDYSIQIDPSKKMEMIEYLKSNLNNTDCKSDMSEIDFSDLIELSDLELALNTGDNILTEFKPVSYNSSVYNYLEERGIDKSLHTNIYQAKHWLNEDRYEPVVVLLNRKENKVLGMQTRNLKSGKFRSFKIYNFEHLYKWTHTEEEFENIDMTQMVIYNKLSYFFNILNVSFDYMITIFEGYLDSLFYPNSIGVTGTNTSMALLEANNLEIQYFFDNDDAGFKKAEEKIKSGFPIFLWGKLFQEIVDKKNPNDPYSLMYKISQVKDLNKLSQLVPNPYKKLELPKFFSKDVFDLKWIPKVKYKKFIKN
jgi:hypothetical protein